MLVEINTDYCKVSVKSNSGLVKEKLVNLSDLLDELSAYRATNFGLLPKNTRLLETKGNYLILGVEFPRSNRQVKYMALGDEEAATIDNVSLPAGLFIEKMMREPGGTYRHIDSYLFALSGNRITFNTDTLYKYPTPNIYEDGRVCWGEVDFGEMRQLSATEGLISSFFCNYFNNDLFYDRVSQDFSGIVSRGVQSYFEYLSQNEFDDNWLLSHDTTITQIVSRLLSRG